MDGRKFYKTIIVVEVLSEAPYNPSGINGIAEDITTGDCSGAWSIKSSKVLSSRAMANALKRQGSDTEFFQLTSSGENMD